MGFSYLAHSQTHTDEAKAATLQYLATHPELDERLEDAYWVLHGLVELTPVTNENAFSGHLFPIFEAQNELASSATAVGLGLYKQGLAGLRAVLELGVLSVHWNVSDESHMTIQGWLRGSEKTPLEREVRENLKKTPGVALYLQHDPSFLDRLRDLSFELGGYVHTRGHRASSRGLNRRANFPLFSDSAFDRWVHLTGEVLRAVLAIHLMKYPVGLQVMPLSDKLGLNVPMGGLVEPHVRDRFRRFLEPAVRDRLQAQSDADPEATALRDQLNALPDLTDGEWRQQIREQDEMLIASSGFENWVSGHEAMRHHRTPEEQVDADIYQQEMRSWAEAHEALTLEQIFSRNQAGNNPV